MHGRVLFQYGHDIGRDELQALDRLTRSDEEGVLLFENGTGMEYRVAATACLSLMTCPRVNGATLSALAAFRDRHRQLAAGF
jgi:hypothetical protein